MASLWKETKVMSTALGKGKPVSEHTVWNITPKFHSIKSFQILSHPRWYKDGEHKT
jgi:hypothetical protein